MYEIIYYKTSKGRVFVHDFIRVLDVRAQAKIRKQILLLSQEGPLLKRPYADYLRNDIYELRIKQRSNYRILYFFFLGRYIILTHGFTKKTRSIPTIELQKAIQYKSDFENRFFHDK